MVDNGKNPVALAAIVGMLWCHVSYADAPVGLYSLLPASDSEGDKSNCSPRDKAGQYVVAYRGSYHKTANVNGERWKVYSDSAKRVIVMSVVDSATNIYVSFMRGSPRDKAHGWLSVEHKDEGVVCRVRLVGVWRAK